MSQLPTHTALGVPTNTSHPSIRCLQWSGDGQVLLATKSALYILTPDPGISFDTASIIEAPINKTRGENDAEPLGWFRTMIEFERAIVHQWPLDSQDWGAVSLGSLDVLLRAVTASPSNVTDGAGCVIAAINSNMEITLWGAVKNHLRGEWKKVQDITASLKDAIASEKTRPSTMRTLQEQVICISWSLQADFGIAPTPNLDGSLLAAGSRGGTVSFFKFDSKRDHGPQVAHAQTISVADKWVTNLAWSSWTISELGKCAAYLACGVSDGSVVILEISQSLSTAPSVTGFGSNFSIETVFNVQQIQPFEIDKRAITALAWAEPISRSPILVACKPGVVHIWSDSWPISGVGSWHGSKKLLLATQALSVGSSSLYPASGITYVGAQDILVLSLFDGSFHVIHNFSSEPSWVPAIDTALTSEKISSTARSVFIESESGVIKQSDVGRISGMTSYDESSTVAWIHEACRPSDLSYKHDARHSSMFIVTQLWDAGNDDDNVIQHLAEVLNTAKAVSGYAPIHLLRPTFLHLRPRGRVGQLYQRVSAVLQLPLADESSDIIIPPFSAGLTPEVKLEFRNSISRHLYGWDSFLSLRLRLAIADYCWKLAGDSETQTAYGQIAQYLLIAILQRIQRTLIRHLMAIVNILTADDVPFVMRYVVQALLPGSPPDLTVEAQELSVKMSLAIPHFAQSPGFEETCPACHAAVPLAELTNAVCANGHVWPRCSITSFILATPLVRTCIGCSRKAFIPVFQDGTDGQRHLRISGRSWLVEELLQAVQRCLFCGNSFVNLI